MKHFLMRFVISDEVDNYINYHSVEKNDRLNNLYGFIPPKCPQCSRFPNLKPTLIWFFNPRNLFDKVSPASEFIPTFELVLT